MQITIRVYRGFAKWEFLETMFSPVVRFSNHGRHLQQRPSQTDAGFCVCARVCVCELHVCRACLLSLSVDARQDAVKNPLLGIHLICKFKKNTPAHLQR